MGLVRRAGSPCRRRHRRPSASSDGRTTRLPPMSEDEFVDAVTEGQTLAPLYFAFAANRNKQAHDVLPEDEPPRSALALTEVLAEQRRGAVVLDSRDPAVFAQGHLVGSYNVGSGRPVRRVRRRRADAEQPIVLVCDPAPTRGPQSAGPHRLRQGGWLSRSIRCRRSSRIQIGSPPRHGSPRASSTSGSAPSRVAGGRCSRPRRGGRPARSAAPAKFPCRGFSTGLPSSTRRADGGVLRQRVSIDDRRVGDAGLGVPGRVRPHRRVRSVGAIRPACELRRRQRETGRFRHVTRYAFLIDQDTCIGCHACTVACKAEHEVPLGVNRTWVKYIEQR